MTRKFPTPAEMRARREAEAATKTELAQVTAERDALRVERELLSALGAPGVPEDRRKKLTAEARGLTRKMLKLCGENGAEVGE